MDPLSVAASAIALLQAAAAIGKGIQVIRSFGRAPAELCSLLNELTTLQALTTRFEEDLKGLDKATISDKSSESALSQLTRVHQELSTTVEQLNNLSQRFVNCSRGLNKDGQHRIPRLRWQLERDNIFCLRKAAQECREYLTAFMTSLQLSHSFEQSNLILRVERSFEISARDLCHSVNEASGIASKTHASVIRLEDRFSTLEKALTTKPRSNTSHTQEGSNLPSGSVICFQTSISQSCHVTCRCQCHKSTSRVSPEYLQPAIGAFFLSYKTFPVFCNNACDDPKCQYRQGSRLQLHYYLPKWLFSRAVHFSLSWDSLTNTGATMNLRIPRVIHTTDSIWETIRCGDLYRLRQRLGWRQNTPSDISPTGMSLLLYALHRGDYNIVTHLISIGCDVSTRDLRGCSPATVARSRLLSSCPTTTGSKANLLYKTILQLAQEALHPELTTLVHDSILGLSEWTLEEAIAMDPSSLESPDGSGYSPLHWAVKRRNPDAIATLFKSCANPNIRDKYLRTPLHLAAKYGNLAICQQLLAAKSDPNAQDTNGKTPLHAACTSTEPESLSIVHLLLRHGAAPDTQDTINHFTPLNNLIHESLAKDPHSSELKIDALLSAGADINTPDKSGCPPILNAASIPWDNELFQILHDRGARMDAVDNYGRGLLHYTAAYGDLAQIEYLRSLKLSARDGLDTRRLDRYGHTPLRLIHWRAGADPRKLWANMTRPDGEDIRAFCGLLREIEGREGEGVVRVTEIVENEDEGEKEDEGDVLYEDAQEYLSPG